MSITCITFDRWLDLNELLEALASQGIISPLAAEQALAAQPSGNLDGHPLEWIASQQLQDLTRPGRMLDLESLTLW
jgi:general secretion pathway protein E